MRRIVMSVAFAAAVLSSVGCLGLNASYVEKRPDGGLVAFHANDREAAIAMLERDYGAVKIEAEYDAKPKSAAFDPTAPVTPGTASAEATSPFASMFGASDEGKMFIKFSKVAGAAPVVKAPPGLPQAPRDSGVLQVGGTAPAAGAPRGGLPKPNFAGLEGVVDCPDGNCSK